MWTETQIKKHHTVWGAGELAGICTFSSRHRCVALVVPFSCEYTRWVGVCLFRHGWKGDAVLEVTLLNDMYGFKFDDYGESITIRRTIKQSGAGGFTLLGHDRKVTDVRLPWATAVDIALPLLVRLVVDGTDDGMRFAQQVHLVLGIIEFDGF